jgi:3-oxoacyl-[acyl-carrier protein] reductase
MKTILITGSSRGIGKAIAHLAHKRGYKVVVHGKSDSSIKVVFDIANKVETKTSISKLLSEVGSIDVLVNNAGIARNFISAVDEVDDDKALEEYSVNVLGTLHCIQSVLPSMLERGEGSVVNIFSIKGHPKLSKRVL